VACTLPIYDVVRPASLIQRQKHTNKDFSLLSNSMNWVTARVFGEPASVSSTLIVPGIAWQLAACSLYIVSLQDGLTFNSVLDWPLHTSPLPSLGQLHSAAVEPLFRCSSSVHTIVLAKLYPYLRTSLEVPFQCRIESASTDTRYHCKAPCFPNRSWTHLAQS
jgi:hypothetical protein